MKQYFDHYIKAVTNPLSEIAEYFDKENQFLKNLINKESIVLDVGCGNGRTIKFLSPFVKRIVGIDYSEKMLGAAKENLENLENVELIFANFLEHNFSQQFDLVYASFNLIGSCETKAGGGEVILGRMVKITKPGGHCVASVWSDVGIDFAWKYYPAIGIKVFEIKDNNVITSFGNFRRFSKNDLDNLGKLIGKNFRIVDLTKIFYLLDISVE